MGFMDKMKNLMGIDDEYDDDFDISQEEIDRYKTRMTEQLNGIEDLGKDYTQQVEEPLNTGISHHAFTEVVPPLSASKNEVNKDSMNNSGPFKMVVIEPKSLDECRKLVDNLKARKPVVINLERVETDLARKMFDFLGGATYALSGTVQRVSQNIFIYAPSNVDIKARIDRATEAGKPEKSNPWK